MQPAAAVTTGQPTADGTAHHTVAHQRMTVLILGTAILAFSLLQAPVAPILPTIARDLHASTTAASWLITTFLLVASVMTPILGRIGDMIGKNRMFVIALSAMALGAAITAVGPNLGVMIVGRGVQGIGGALIPLAFGIVRDEFPPERVAGIIGILAALLGAGGGLGGVLAGPISETLGYRWLFWLPGILIALAAIGASRFIPASPVRMPGRVSWLSAVLLSGWLVALLLAITESTDWGWGSGRELGLLLVSAILFVVWLLNERRSQSPVIDLQMMRLPSVWRMNALGLLSTAVLYTVFVFIPQFAQTPRSAGYGFGASVTISGLMLLPSAAATMAAGLVAARLARRFGVKTTMVLGAGLILLGALALCPPIRVEALIYVITGVLGFGSGLMYALMSSVLASAVRPEQTGVANGMASNLRNVGAAFGVAVVATIVSARLQSDGHPVESGYTIGFVAMAGVAVATLIIAFSMRNPARPSVQPVVE